MIVTLNFKTPDVTEHALEDYDETAQEEIMATINQFVRWGECVSIEFDTATQTARVKPV